MVSMKLIVLGNIPLGIWIVILLRPSDCVTHVLHNCYTLDGLNVEIIFRNSSSVPLGG